MKKLLIFVIFGIVMLTLSNATFADNVTFKVDMSYLNSVGLFDPATQGAAVRGSMTNWHDSPENLPDWTMADADADLIYEGTFDVGTDTPINYKFVIVDLATNEVGWESDPNRSLALTGADQVLDPVVWEVEVTFQVDMTRAEALGLFNPAENGVSLRGNMTSWNDDPATLPDWALTDDDADKVYKGTFTGINTSTLSYKYVITAADTLKNWEEAISNREDTLGIGDMTLEVAFWDSIPPVATAITANVLFKVDVLPLQELGAFDPTLGDTLQIRGQFNGWNDENPEDSIMRQSFVFPTQYEITVPITAAPGDLLPYKFFIAYDDQGGTREVPESGWEEPGSTGGANREYTFGDQVQQEVPIQVFNDISIDDVIPEGSSVTVEMTADMRCALRNTELALPAGGPLQADTQDPIWRFITGTVNPDSDPTSLVFEDAEGDSVFTLMFDLVGPAPNWVQYKLQWAGTDEEGSDTQAVGRRRVRFVRKNADDTWPTTFKMGVDVWNGVTGSPLVVETPDGVSISDDPPCDVIPVYVEMRDGAVPGSYSLGQNYPNPFNPTTTIDYSLKQAGHVSIIVYNRIGQEVARLVDESQPAGSYSVHWDTISNSYLSSGVYYYQMKAGDFVENKRLVLLK